MSSMSFWKNGSLIADLSIGRARSRSTGCPMRATFRMDIAVNYMVPLKTDTTTADAAARRASLQSLPALRRRPGVALAQTDGTGPSGLHALRLHLLSGPEGGCR